MDPETADKAEKERAERLASESLGLEGAYTVLGVIDIPPERAAEAAREVEAMIAEHQAKP